MNSLGVMSTHRLISILKVKQFSKVSLTGVKSQRQLMVECRFGMRLMNLAFQTLQRREAVSNL
jgi:hypothetical protein